MNIAEYYASIGFRVNRQDIRRVDNALSSIEMKLKAFKSRMNKSFSLNINKFDVDQRRLNIALGTALDLASRQVTFEVTKFAIDRASLNRALSSVGVLGGSGVGVASTRIRNPSTEQLRRRGIRNAEFDRQEALRRGLADRRFGLQGQRLSLQEERLSSGGGSRATGRVVGGIGLGIGGRLGYGALALVGGGYGIGALNQRNQQVVSAQLQSQAVVQQAGGTAEQGKESFQYLRSEANRIGFNYLDASQDYNKLISGLTGSGVGVKESQKVFSGFAELARVNKLDKTTQNRLFRALSQVAGKGKLQAEELTGQISEALPGGTALFARAYQDQLRATGRGKGDLTGQAAIQALQADMKKGLVTSDILTYAGTAASRDAATGLPAAQQASQAEQQRYQNAVNDIAVVASDAGVEEGFARIFRTLNAGLSESNGLIKLLAEGFNEATKFSDDLLLFPQDFVRALEGRDSLVADWLGQDATKQLQEDWKSIRESLTTISTIGAPSWLPTLETVSKDIAAQFRIIAAISNGDFSGLGKGLKDFAVNRYKAYGDALTSGPNFGLRVGGELLDIPVPQLTTGGLSFRAPRSVRESLNLGSSLERLPSLDPLANALNDSTGYTDVLSGDFSIQLAALQDQQRQAAMAVDQSYVKAATVSNDIRIQLNIDPITLGQLNIQAQAQELAQAIALNLEQVLVQFPQKE